MWSELWRLRSSPERLLIFLTSIIHTRSPFLYMRSSSYCGSYGLINSQDSNVRKVRKFSKILLLVGLFAMLGFCREFYFVNINNIMNMKYYDNPSLIPIPGIMRPFTSLEYSTLYYSKYISTAICCFLFFLVSRLAIILIIGNQYIVRILLYT